MGDETELTNDEKEISKQLVNMNYEELEKSLDYLTPLDNKSKLIKHIIDFRNKNAKEMTEKVYKAEEDKHLQRINDITEDKKNTYEDIEEPPVMIKQRTGYNYIKKRELKLYNNIYNYNKLLDDFDSKAYVLVDGANAKQIYRSIPSKLRDPKQSFNTYRTPNDKNDGSKYKLDDPVKKFNIYKQNIH